MITEVEPYFDSFYRCLSLVYFGKELYWEAFKSLIYDTLQTETDPIKAAIKEICEDHDSVTLGTRTNQIDNGVLFVGAAYALKTDVKVAIGDGTI